MSKKNRHKNPWQLRKPATEVNAHSEPGAPATGGICPPATGVPQTPPIDADFSPISPAQLAANRANAQLSTGPRTSAGVEKSSKNAVKTALTGRTVLLPTDDVEEYAAFIAEFQHDLKPVGAIESELVQIIADCHWRLRRIQTLEYALYAHGHEQFADAFPNCPADERYSKILLQTHLTYEKQLRNLQIQEARIDRKRAKAIAELENLQAERNHSEDADNQSDAAPFASEADFFAALDAGYVPPRLAAHFRAEQQSDENGFDFSNDGAAPDLAVGEGLEKEAA